MRSLLLLFLKQSSFPLSKPSDYLMELSRIGTVYLVGAGPGDPELITARGLRLLQQADVVVYDRLVHPALIQTLPKETERIFVGKAPGKQMLPQDGIHVLLIARAMQGCNVVRLKGGDPFVFGRGGEECLALAEAGIPYEVVPGVSSAVAAASYAGIPVTQRGVAQGFSVVTGHTRASYDEEPDWIELVRMGTLVIMMGLKNLERIVTHLLDNAQPPSTPVAVVANASTHQQEVVEAPLHQIVGLTAHLKPPATVIIGDVVKLRRSLDWFSSSTLAGYTNGQDVFTFPDLDTLTAITQPLNNE
ncbi:MAG: uroporphyrinogen-III C-methyltransferase [Rhodothermaceae bacterium]|nr:uroporphyrinogen-III C-methyltransferase [Rhodothermaceae bacterium]